MALGWSRAAPWVLAIAVLAGAPATAAEWCSFSNSECMKCQHAAFEQYRATNCWTSDRNVDQRLQCSREMSAWLRQARESCVAQTLAQDGGRGPASEGDDPMPKLLRDNIETAKKLVQQCRDLAAKTKTFKDRMLENFNTLMDHFKEQVKQACEQ